MAQETKEWKVLTVEDCIANLESLSANRAHAAVTGALLFNLSSLFVVYSHWKRFGIQEVPKS